MNGVLRTAVAGGTAAAVEEAVGASAGAGDAGGGKAANVDVGDQGRVGRDSSWGCGACGYSGIWLERVRRGGLSRARYTDRAGRVGAGKSGLAGAEITVGGVKGTLEND